MHIPPQPEDSRRVLPKIKVLVAEDSRTNQEIAKAILDSIGVEVTVVSDGAAAVEAVIAERFDLILMDIHMPDMDGYEAARRIHGDARFRLLPIIALTASETDEAGESYLRAGMDGFIAKPIHRDAMLETLRRFVERFE